MIITKEVIESILRKNGRAKRKMARRCLRKVDARNNNQLKKYTKLELELQRISRVYSFKENKKRTKIFNEVGKMTPSQLAEYYKKYIS